MAHLSARVSFKPRGCGGLDRLRSYDRAWSTLTLILAECESGVGGLDTYADIVEAVLKIEERIKVALGDIGR